MVLPRSRWRVLDFLDQPSGVQVAAPRKGDDAEVASPCIFSNRARVHPNGVMPPSPGRSRIRPSGSAGAWMGRLPASVVPALAVHGEHARGPAPGGATSGGKIMATDLKDTPVAGLDAQLCGDAHLSNFGAFASPERTLLFDLNDFDETLPGPFEYDVKRMAASFTIAARNNGFTNADARAAALMSVAAYREAMAGFAEMPTMDIWYAHLSEEVLLSAVKNATRSLKRTEKSSGAKAAEKRAAKTAAKAHTRDSLQALSKLAER